MNNSVVKAGEAASGSLVYYKYVSLLRWMFVRLSRKKYCKFTVIRLFIRIAMSYLYFGFILCKHVV